MSFGRKSREWIVEEYRSELLRSIDRCRCHSLIRKSMVIKRPSIRDPASGTKRNSLAKFHSQRGGAPPIPAIKLNCSQPAIRKSVPTMNYNMILSPTAQDLLSDGTYDIEFFGFLSNHAKHAIVALKGLNAPEERIKEYWDRYTSETPYGIPLHRVSQPNWRDVTPSSSLEFREWRGRKKNWQEQQAMMWQEMKQKGGGENAVDDVVREYAPELLDGIAGALMHGIIHLGWGIDAGSPWMVAEGLSYLNFCHIGVHPSKFRYCDDPADGGATPIESLSLVANLYENDDLRKTWVEIVKAKYDKSFHPELVKAGFQWEAAKLMAEPHDVVVRMPSWISAADQYSEAEEEQTWDALYRAVTYLYLASRDENNNGSFIVLHLITSLWGLEHVCRKLQARPDYSIIRKRAWSQYYATAVVLLSAVGFLPSAAIEKVCEEISPNDATSDDFSWDPVVQAGTAEVEEHNIKLVYVCRELWKCKGRHWKGYAEAAKAFTLTPVIKGAFNSDKNG